MTTATDHGLGKFSLKKEMAFGVIDLSEGFL
jgi:hypothetical protein